MLIEPIIYGDQFVYNLSGWYVIPLFLTHAFYIFVRKVFLKMIKNTGEYFLFLAELALGILGVSLAQKGYYTGAYLILVRTLYLVPFYGLGILYKTKLEEKDNASNITYFSMIFILKLIIITIYGRTLSYTVVYCKDFNENPIMPFIVGTIGIAFWLRVASILNPILKESKAIKIISDCSYSIMIHQFLGFMFVKTIYALISLYTPFFSDFDILQYKTNIWYYYFPRGIYHWGILYVIAGVVIPVLIQKAIDRVKYRCKLLKQNI